MGMVEWWYEMIGCVQIHRHFKGQNNKNHQKLNSHTENEETRARGDAGPCHLGRTTVRQAPRVVVPPTVSPWWPLVSPVPTLLERCILMHFLVCRFCFGFPESGLLGFVCNSSWCSGPSTSFFLLLLGSIYVNLKLKIPNKPNKRSRRNKGASHKIKHINPQEWVLNTQLIHAYMTVIKLPHA